MANNYWIDRQNRLMDKAELSEDAYLRSLSSYYRKTQYEIEAVINEMYAKYGKEGKLTFQQLATIDEKRRISRLEAMKQDIANKISGLTNKTHSKLKKELKGNYKDSYYRTKYNLQTFNGMGASFDLLPDKQINRAIDSRWVDEQNYSERLWVNRNKLVNNLYEAVGQTIARGLSVQECASMIQKEMDSSYSAAIRLARTEINHICNEAAIDAYKDEGIEYYQFLATLDDRTSDICRELDGRIFPIKEKMEGVNCPPMHPNCRSTIIPVIDIDRNSDAGIGSYKVTNEDGTEDTKKGRISGQLRVSRINGEVQYVPGDITYKSWYNKYIENDTPVTEEERLKTLLEDTKMENIKVGDKVVPVDVYEAEAIALQLHQLYDAAEKDMTTSIINAAESEGINTEGIASRMKTEGSLTRKIRDDYAQSVADDKHKSMLDVAKDEADINRYTLILKDNKFGDQFEGVVKSMEKEGYVLGRVKNTFGDMSKEYWGVNTVFFNKQGLPMEVQFHTQDSFDIKQYTNHQYYEIERDLTRSEKERADAHEEIIKNTHSLEVPNGMEKVENLNDKMKIDSIRKELGLEDPFDDIEV